LARVFDHPARRSVVIKDPDDIRLQFYVDRDWTPATFASISDETALDLL
jgi:catechol 2,3-dioxygenase